MRFGQGYASYVAALQGQELVGCAQLGRLAVGGYFVLRCDFVSWHIWTRLGHGPNGFDRKKNHWNLRDLPAISPQFIWDSYGCTMN